MMFKMLAAEYNFRLGRRRGDVSLLRRAAKQNIHNSRAAAELARLGVPENICTSLLINLAALRAFTNHHQLATQTKDLLELAIRQLEISRGQLFQDVAASYFSGQKRDGFFLEVGTGDGETLSNTHMLEKHFGWRGILFEPDRRFHRSIESSRSAILDTRPAFSSDDTAVQFLEVSRAGELSTLGDFKRVDGRHRFGSYYSAQTVTLTSALEQHRAPSHIDYVSIDTEGSELEVLKGFDLATYNVRFMTIEHNFVAGRRDAIAQYLLPYGYREVCSELSHQDIWVLKD